VNIALLRFIHLTLSICAGIECQDTKQRRKTKKKYKGQIAMASRRWAIAESVKIAPNSQRRVEGEPSQWVPEATHHQLAMASGRRANLQWRVERRGGPESKGSEFAMANNILTRRVRAAKTPQSWRGRNPLVKKLNSPWRMHLLVRRVESEQEYYKSSFDHFSCLLSYFIERDHAKSSVLHRVRVIEGGFFHICGEITSLYMNLHLSIQSCKVTMTMSR